MSKQQDQLEVLEPSKEIEINGEKIIVNEITFGQAMDLGGRIGPLVSSLAKSLSGDSIESDSAITAMYEHKELMFDMLEMSTGKTEEYFRTLNDSDGYYFLIEFFTVNHGFFGKRLLTSALQKKKIKDTQRTMKVQHG